VKEAGSRIQDSKALRVVRHVLLTPDSWLLNSSSMYSEKVLEHFHHPRNAGEIENATVVVEASNPVCGDLMKLWVRLENGTVAEARFKAAGCVPAVACGSWLTEWMSGRALVDLSALAPDQIEAALGGLPPASKHAAVLAADALASLLDKAR